VKKPGNHILNKKPNKKGKVLNNLVPNANKEASFSLILKI